MKKEDFYNTKFYLDNNEEDNNEVQERLFALGFKWCSSSTLYPHLALNRPNSWVLVASDNEMQLCSFDPCPGWPVKTLHDLKEEPKTNEDKPYAFSEAQLSYLVGALRAINTKASEELLNGLSLTFPDAPVFVKEKTYSIGDRFIYKGVDPMEEFILCATGKGEVGLVSLSKGDLFTAPVYVEDLKSVPLKDLQERLQSAGYDFERDFTLVPKQDV